ncbi:condensation domain-containing protein [Streptomyces stramineus]
MLHGDEGSVLLIAVHHLVHDGASILLLLDALRGAYAGHAPAPADHIGPLTAYARRSRELADTPAGDAQRAHWRTALGTGTTFELPASVDEPGYTVLSTEVPAALVPRLRERAGELGVSYFTVLLGGYFALLRRFAGEDDLLASIPFHGRSRQELRDKIGYFVNALPIRRQVRGTDSYADLIRTLRDEVRAATAHGDLPLPAILREASPDGRPAPAPTRPSSSTGTPGCARTSTYSASNCARPAPARRLVLPEPARHGKQRRLHARGHGPGGQRRHPRAVEGPCRRGRPHPAGADGTALHRGADRDRGEPARPGGHPRRAGRHHRRPGERP